MSNDKRPVFAGNWKLFGSLSESVALANAVRMGLLGFASEAADIALAPGFLAIPSVVASLSGSSIEVAGQDCHWESKGAFTGEIAAAQLLDAGCRGVILGHSERRQLMGETDADVNRKTKAALSAGLIPITCVGETLSERKSGATLTRIGAQLEACLAGLSTVAGNRLRIAYEPVWAIGTGLTATPGQAEEVHKFIRMQLQDRFGAAGQEISILYGGSVKPDNIATLMAEENVDGALIGGASLSAESFVRIVKEGTDAWSRS